VAVRKDHSVILSKKICVHLRHLRLKTHKVNKGKLRVFSPLGGTHARTFYGGFSASRPIKRDQPESRGINRFHPKKIAIIFPLKLLDLSEKSLKNSSSNLGNTFKKPSIFDAFISFSIPPAYGSFPASFYEPRSRSSPDIPPTHPVLAQ
jgi:hypothetical protein